MKVPVKHMKRFDGTAVCEGNCGVLAAGNEDPGKDDKVKK